jgi:hypothetical protein
MLRRIKRLNRSSEKYVMQSGSIGETHANELARRHFHMADQILNIRSALLQVQMNKK